VPPGGDNVTIAIYPLPAAPTSRIPIGLDVKRRLVTTPAGTVRLGPTGFRIVEVLAGCPAGLEHESLYERTYLDRDDGGPGDDSFHATLSQLRRKLTPLGLQIPRANRWVAIYRLTAGGA
jgi:hypothetical protein